METNEIQKKPKGPGILTICAILATESGCIAYLREHGLLRSTATCKICNIEMKLVPKKDSSDGEIYRCNQCYSKRSIRDGSLFQGSRLKLTTITLLVYFFGLDMQIYECEKFLPEISHTTVIEWFGILRDLCTRKLIKSPCVLNGDVSGNIIEIDESLFGKKRKYHRGKGHQTTWVFGAVERSTRNAFFHIVDKRDKDTLIPIITSYISKGSTIYSDKWGAYFTLTDAGYTHDTVNHSKEFKSESGCCTNTIEGLWGLAKLRIKKMKGIGHDKLPIIIDEFMYRYRFGHENGDVYFQLLQDIKELHPFL